MNFNQWLQENSNFDKWIIFEMSGIENGSTDHLEFDEEMPENCEDESLFFEDCKKEFEDTYQSEYMDDMGIYDDPEDDPEFDFYYDEPEPERSEYETDKEYEEDYEYWQSERDDAEEYAREEWYREMRTKRQEAKEEMEREREEFIEDCIEEKKEDCMVNNSEHKISSIWYIDGQQYKAEFTNSSYDELGTPIKDIWEIVFSSKGSYGTTNLNQGNQVYKDLLLSVKKLIETKNVNGLKFSPHEPAMVLVYKKFVDTYLKKDFVLYDEILLKKKIIRDILEKADPRRKKEIITKIKDSNVMLKDQIKDVRKKKEETRTQMRALKRSIGKPVRISKEAGKFWGGKIGLLVEAEYHSGKIMTRMIVLEVNRLAPIDIIANHLDLSSPVSQEEALKLADLLATSQFHYNFPIVTQFINDVKQNKYQASSLIPNMPQTQDIGKNNVKSPQIMGNPS